MQGGLGAGHSFVLGGGLFFGYRIVTLTTMELRNKLLEFIITLIKFVLDTPCPGRHLIVIMCNTIIFLIQGIYCLYQRYEIIYISKYISGS